MIDDAELSRFALGVAPVAGVILAVLASIFLFILNRRWSEEMNAVSQVRGHMENLSNLFVAEVRKARLYFAEEEYDEFTGYISWLRAIDSFENLPDHFDWRDKIKTVQASIVSRLDADRELGMEQLLQNGRLIFAI